MRCLEFYSGIGGMRFALRSAFRDLSSTRTFDDERDDGVVCAFDVNLIANQTYQHNFHKKRSQPKQSLIANNKNTCREEVCSLGIDYLTPEDLDRHQADLWLMSPPCQPYTSLGLQKGSEDMRANSFLHLMSSVLPHMRHKPSYLIVENVPGFEVSDTHSRLISILCQLGYSIEQFLLSPTQFGIPNHRLRYYLIAKRHHNDNNTNNISLDPQVVHPPLTYLPDCSNCSATPSSVRPLCEFLETNLSKAENERYRIPKKFFKANHYKFDIASINTTTAVSCFTKGYGKTWRGAGPVLWKPELATTFPSSQIANVIPTTTATINQSDEMPETLSDSLKTMASTTLTFVAPEERGLPKDAAMRIRLFSPREIANLLCFPPEFEFPSSLTVTQQYRLLGNSLNVLVVSELIKYLLKDMTFNQQPNLWRQISSGTLESIESSYEVYGQDTERYSG
eukprot:TRINITY_DN2405_c0_g1_i3.p1 TRINITY_DN2405_c0_g1~~TRINITY_DN2405_c0_g1_i3.p1  ORF type:complete len:451 (+),score=81.63 TRINITY_DN2405_c0_g1_i3:446-1798(+)